MGNKKPAPSHPWRKRQAPRKKSIGRLYTCNVCSPDENIKISTDFDYYASGLIRSTCKQCRSAQCVERRLRTKELGISELLKRWRVTHELPD